jgi:hypothetical protein
LQHRGTHAGGAAIISRASIVTSARPLFTGPYIIRVSLLWNLHVRHQRALLQPNEHRPTVKEHTVSTNFREWMGKAETVSDIVTATPYAALSATLDRSARRPETATTLAGALALALFPASASTIRNWSRWACETRRFFTAGSLTPAHVGRQSVRILPAAPGRGCRHACVDDTGLTEKSERTGRLVFVKVRTRSVGRPRLMQRSPNSMTLCTVRQ